ncbi:P-loop containing nucleoside triphosphate hydrolase protein [Paraphysoderma sedebokerense]|nr:P-loop containing nucleoside triphosphate hydrolase protein [Paraphysoderma sedebokerense]
MRSMKLHIDSDNQTAPISCVLPTDIFRRLSSELNQWVQILTTTNVYYSKALPALSSHQTFVSLRGPLISRAIHSSDNLSLQLRDLGENECIVQTISCPLPRALTVCYSIKSSNKQDESFTIPGKIPFAPKLIQSLIRDYVLFPGARILHPWFEIEVSTIEPTTPCLPSFSTRFTCQTSNEINDIPELKTYSSSASSIPGLEAVSAQLLELVKYPLLFPDLFDLARVQAPRGVLLHGPPGVGKTLVVSHLAQWCNAELITIHPPTVLSPFLGQSEKNLRQKFEKAQELASQIVTTSDGTITTRPVIVFIDEFDAIAPSRNSAASSQTTRLVTQLLTLMDGISTKHSMDRNSNKSLQPRIVIIASTNRPHTLDPALRRPGRFDREIQIMPPDVDTRARILENLLSFANPSSQHISKVNLRLSNDVDIQELAKWSNGFVGADLAMWVREVCSRFAKRAMNRTTELSNLSDSTSVSDSATPPVDVIRRSDFFDAFKQMTPSLTRGHTIDISTPLTWYDVGGLPSVKQVLQQSITWPLIHSETFIRLGIAPTRGVLLYGPPGCSKTTLAKILARQSGFTFLSINGAQVFSPYVGDSESIIRSTFHLARLSSPTIIFVDEIDAIVSSRFDSQQSGTSDSVQSRVLSTLLNEMDGIENATGVVVVAATNRPNVLDPALLRPGRFDKLVYVPPPDKSARKEIFKIYTKNLPLGESIDWEKVLEELSDLTGDCTGADIENLCREAALLALRRSLSLPNPSKGSVLAQDFMDALNLIRPTLTAEMMAMYESLSEKFL